MPQVPIEILLKKRRFIRKYRKEVPSHGDSARIDEVGRWVSLGLQ